MLAYVSELDHEDYQDWLCMPSSVRLVDITEVKQLDYRLTWLIPICLAGWSFWSIEWGYTLDMLAQVLCGVIAVTVVVIAELCEEAFIPLIPTWAHFLLWGCSRKYRHSKWHPPALPPYLISTICALVQLPLASWFVAFYYMMQVKKAE